MKLINECIDYFKRNPQVRCIKIPQYLFNKLRRESLLDSPLHFGNVDRFMLLNPVETIWITPSQYIGIKRNFKV